MLTPASLAGSTVWLAVGCGLAMVALKHGGVGSRAVAGLSLVFHGLAVLSFLTTHGH